MATETPEQLQAFQIYYNMGPDRSYRKLGEKVGKHYNTIMKWAKKFKWKQRIDEIDNAVSKDVVESTARATILAKEQSKMLHQMLKDRFYDEVAQGDVKIRSIREYIDIDKHDLLVRGEATERRESVNVELKGKVKDMLSMMGQKVAKLPEAEIQEVRESLMDGEVIDSESEPVETE